MAPKKAPKKRLEKLAQYKLRIVLTAIIGFAAINTFYILFLLHTARLIDAQGSETAPKEYMVSTYPYLASRSEIPVSAQSFVVYDPVSRVVVHGNNEYLRFTPASATKIMTALIALDYYNLDTVLIAQYPESVLGSKMGLFHGENITVRNILYGLMLPSGNDAATTLAQNYPGGTAAFVQKMNEKARALQLENTKLVDPSGIEDENYTTAYDLARLASYAMQNPTFREIVATRSIIVYNTNYTISHRLENLNELLYQEGVTGVKTGFTDEAGGVLVTAFTVSGKQYMLVVLKSQDRFSDTQRLMNEVVKNIQIFSY